MYHNIVCFLFVLTASIMASTATAGEKPSGITRQIVNKSVLENVPGNNLTAVEVKLTPGFSTPSHTHGGFVFVYVLEGKVRSQLNNGETVEYTAGQSWTEPPGTLHSLTHNPSTTDTARLLAIFVAKNGSELTTFGNDH